MEFLPITLGELTEIVRLGCNSIMAIIDLQTGNIFKNVVLDADPDTNNVIAVFGNMPGQCKTAKEYGITWFAYNQL